MKTLLSLVLLASSLLCAASALDDAEKPQQQQQQQKQQKLLKQLNISGCPVTVRGSPMDGKKLGSGSLKLALDPLLCVAPGSLKAAVMAAPRYDPIARQTFLSVPVRLTDAAVSGAVAMELHQHVKSSGSPKDAVVFADVTRVEVSTDPGSVFAALGFVWSQGESVGFLRLGCSSVVDDASDSRGSSRAPGAVCSIDQLLENLRSGNNTALERVRLSVSLAGEPASADYRVTVAAAAASAATTADDRQLLDFAVSSRDAASLLLPQCNQWLQPVRIIRFGNCTAMAYQSSIGKGAYHVEQPICGTGLPGKLSARPDYSRERHSLTLSLLLAPASDNDTAMAPAWEQLGDLRPVSVGLMPVWRARHVVSSFLAGRFDVGPLMAPTAGGGGKLGQLRLHCSHMASCRYMRSKIVANPVDFWRHIEWNVSYLANIDGITCAHSPAAARFSRRMEDSTGASAAAAAASGARRALEAAAWREACPDSPDAHCQYRVLPPGDGRHFVVVQQRTVGSQRFDRPWADYVAGFGDSSDFWIGLTALHLLTSHGTTLRLELPLWNGTKFVSEYAGFKVGDASTNYRMTYRERTQSNVDFDAMATHQGMPFSTFDRDHDNDEGSCSLTWGRGGWWFNKCYKLYVNGQFPTTNAKDWKFNTWASDSEVVPLKHTRMMLLV